MRSTVSGGPSSESAPSAGLRRDIEILDLLSGLEGQRGLGVNRMATQLRREKSQVSRALKALEAEGMVERDSISREYRLGWRVYALAARTSETRLAQIAAPFLHRLTAQLNESVYLCVLRGSRVITLVTIAAPHAWRGFMWEGVSVPAPMTAAGRVLLSDWAPDVLAEWLAGASAALDIPVRIVRTTDEIAGEIASAREHGYAVVDGEFEEGHAGVAAPVRDFRGAIAAAVTVSGPKSRLGEELDAVGRIIADVAHDLSLAARSPLLNH